MDPHIRLDRGRVPCHWYVVSSREGIGFRHRERNITLEAVEVDGLDCDFSGRWRLQYRCRANEAESCREVGRVTSKGEALEALFSWMEAINREIRTEGDVRDVVALGRAAVGGTAHIDTPRAEPRERRSGDGWYPDQGSSRGRAHETVRE